MGQECVASQLARLSHALKSVKVRGIRELVSHVDKVVFTQAHKIDQSLIHNRFKLLAIFDMG